MRARDRCPWSPGPPIVEKGRNRPVSRLGRPLVFLSCALGLVLLARAVLAGRLPGWDLVGVILLYAAGKLFSEVRVRALVRLWRARVAVALPVVALHVCLIGWLANHFFGRRPGTIWLAGALVSGILLFRKRTRVSLSAWFVLLAIGLGFLFFNAWWYAMIGDEAWFWETASDIAKHHGLGTAGEHLFRLEDSRSGTYPYLSALIPAAGLAVGGVNNFGWKFGNVFLSSLAIAFFFPFF